MAGVESSIWMVTSFDALQRGIILTSSIFQNRTQVRNLLQFHHLFGLLGIRTRLFILRRYDCSVNLMNSLGFSLRLRLLKFLTNELVFFIY